MRKKIMPQRVGETFDLGHNWEVQHVEVSFESLSSSCMGPSFE